MVAPVVTSLGHAGLRVDAAHLRLLCDPWMSPRGAFLGSWFPFPDNSHLLRPDVLDAEWVTISHEHLDHLDLDLLGLLPDHVRIVIPRYPAPEMLSRLRGAGIRNVVVELDRWERLALDRHGDWMTVIQEQSPMCHDAAVLLFVDGHAILHTNDARLTPAQLRRAVEEVERPIDLMGVQMSGASWHPICYEYPPEVVDSMSADKRLGKFKSVSRLLRAAPPKVVMPYAGPPCFLDPALAHHNDRIAPPGIFPDTGQAAAYLRSRLRDQTVVRLLPGDRLDVGTGTVEQDPHWEGFRLVGDRDGADPEGRLPDDLRAYLSHYAERRAADLAAVYAAYPDPPRGSGLAQRFSSHFAQLGGLSDYFLHRIGMTVRFVVTGDDGGTWDVELGPTRCSVDLTGSTPAPGYRITVEARWLDAVLTGRVRWEDLFLSLRISCWRDPDRYNDYLVGLLKHADAAALDEVERYETERDPDDTVRLAERCAEGTREWEVSRYCPHAGEDLAHGAVIRDGVLRCLAHNFEFDLGTGECLNARCDPLVSRRAVSAAVAP